MFQGFTPEAVEFLWGIKFNNNREWFLPRKEQFLALVDRPMRELGRISQAVAEITRLPHLPRRSPSLWQRAV